MEPQFVAVKTVDGLTVIVNIYNIALIDEASMIVLNGVLADGTSVLRLERESFNFLVRKIQAYYQIHEQFDTNKLYKQF